MKNIVNLTFDPLFGVIVILAVTTTSCRTLKHQFEHQRTVQQSHLSESQYGQKIIQKDSAKRYWSVVTDSILYFHPDSGIRAYGGRFYGEEYTSRIQRQQTGAKQRDSIFHNHYSQSKDRVISSRNTILWLVSLFLLIGFLSRRVYVWLKGN